MDESTINMSAHKPGKWMPSIGGGLLLGFLSGIPFLAWINCFCCTGVMLGGFLAVYMYQQELDNTHRLTFSDDAILGLLAGLLGALVAGIMETLYAGISMDAFFRIADFINNPRLEEWIYQIDPHRLAKGFLLLKFLGNFLLFPVFTLTGAIITVAFYSKSSKTTALPKE